MTRHKGGHARARAPTRIFLATRRMSLATRLLSSSSGSAWPSSSLPLLVDPEACGCPPSPLECYRAWRWASSSAWVALPQQLCSFVEEEEGEKKGGKRGAVRPYDITRLEFWKLAVVLPALGGWIWVVYSIGVGSFQAMEGNTLHGNTTQENATQWIAIRDYVMRCTTMQCNTLQCNAMRVWEARVRKCG